MSEKLGRNDPCYCGSGQKYKQCHQPIDKKAAQERRNWDLSAQWLRRELLKFAREERFNELFARAVGFYWNDLYSIDNAEEMSEDEAFRFFDWFVYDYVGQATPDEPENPRLVDTYAAEKREKLAHHQALVLEAWQPALPSGAYLLTGVTGQNLQLSDLLTRQEIVVYTAGGRGNLMEGDVVLARPLAMFERLQFSTTAAYLPQAELDDLPDRLATVKKGYLADHPAATDEDFMRRHNHLLIHHALEQAKLAGRPPVARLDPNRPDSRMRQLAQRLRGL